MFRSLKIGLPIVILIVIAFVVAMNTVPISSPYFTWVIVGYVVLFPAALLFTIVGTIRGARRAIAGGDPSLKERGERTMATVVAARPLNMTMRMSGGPQLQMYRVELKPDNQTPAISTTKTSGPFEGAPATGDRVPLYLDPDNARNHFIDWAQSSGTQRVEAGSDLAQLISRLQGAAPRREPAAGPMEAGGGSEGGLEGRARIEGLKPYPDGSYDLDLYVTPRGRSSYRVAARVAVPAGTGLLEKGQTLNVRIDPDIASRVEVVWD